MALNRRSDSDIQAHLKHRLSVNRSSLLPEITPAPSDDPHLPTQQDMNTFCQQCKNSLSLNKVCVSIPNHSVLHSDHITSSYFQRKKDKLVCQ